jgi:2Fe-2S ferredoxin
VSEITFVAADGTATECEAQVGLSVMQIAANAAQDGIVAECGGSMMCATCHVYLDATAMDYFPERSDDEEEMLDLAISEVKDTSRLSCQLKVHDDTPSFTATLPERQV